MYKKRCIIFMIILFINMMTVNAFASGAINAGYGQSGGNTGNSEQETKPVYSTGNVGNPSTGTPNYVSGNEVIDTREKLEEKLSGYVKEGTLELNALGKQETSLEYIQGVLNQVPEGTLQQWYNTEGKANFNSYSSLVREVDRGLSQNSNLRDRINYMDNNFADWRDYVSSNNGTNSSMTQSPQENNKNQNSSGGTSPSTGMLGNSSSSTVHTPDEIITEANEFVSQGTSSPIDGERLKGASSTLYNLLLSIGIFLSVGIGMYLGVKFMLSTAEDKAKVKEALIPYIVGCVIIFSAFIIWKAVILLLGGIS